MAWPIVDDRPAAQQALPSTGEASDTQAKSSEFLQIRLRQVTLTPAVAQGERERPVVLLVAAGAVHAGDGDVVEADVDEDGGAAVDDVVHEEAAVSRKRATRCGITTRMSRIAVE